MSPLSWLQTRMSAFHVPEPVRGQSEPLSVDLPYEDLLSDRGRTIVVLSDGAIGLVWELALIPHEVRTNDQIATLSRGVAQVLSGIEVPDAIVQWIYDVRPAWSIPSPPATERTVAQDIVARRIAHLEGMAAGTDLGGKPFRTMHRRLYLTLRLQGRGTTGVWGRALLGVAAAEAEAARQFAAQRQRLLDIGAKLEEGLEAWGLDPAPCDGDGVLALLRGAWHDEGTLQHHPGIGLPHDPSRRLGSQVLKDFVQCNRAGVSVGDDTWEVLSWMQQPQRVAFGLFSVLTGLGLPLRCVLTVRPCPVSPDLTVAAAQLKAPLLDSERKHRHLEELRYVEERQAHGEALLSCGLHLLVKNEGVGFDGLEAHGLGRSVGYALTQSTGIEVVVERDAAAGVFLLTQPLATTPSSGAFTGRELRVLTSALGPYLPVFGGFAGTSRAPVHRVQLMHSRAADPVWLSLRANETSPHLAVLASTGAGKSFYLANLVNAEVAAHPDALVFILDSLTSYQVLGEVLGEDGGFRQICPPQTCPNIWEGQLTTERLSVVVGLLRAALGLVDPSFVLRNEHTTLLEGAITKAFSDRQLEASTHLDLDLGLLRTEARGPTARPLPRLSDVVAGLAHVAAERGLPAVWVDELTTKLAPFLGDGRYAALFDAEAEATESPPTPAVTLYDFGAIEDPTVRALLLFICVAEVVRQVMRPENRGRPGVLLLDEAGVLLSQPGQAGEALVRFVQTAWKTFRKLSVACIGATNEPADYQDKAGPRTIWSNSPNKVLLRLKADDLRLAQMEDRSTGRPALFEGALLADLAASLRKVDGAYSQGLFVSDETVGSFTYVPSGHDYWLAASKPAELDHFRAVTAVLSSPGAALHWLAAHHPMGVRDAHGQLRALRTEEICP